MTGPKTSKRGVGDLAAILVLARVAFAQTPAPARYRQEWHRAPFLNLSDAKTVPTRYRGDCKGAVAESNTPDPGGTVKPSSETPTRRKCTVPK
jgi:hypothetical protein